MTEPEVAPTPVALELQDGQAVPPAESESLADHEAAFGEHGTGTVEAPDAETPDTTETQAERDDKGRFRHRAVSQKATSEDVAQINALTKELRAKEQELAKVKPDALAGSPRLLALKRQIKAIEAELGVSTEKPAPPARQPVAETPKSQQERPTGAAFTEKEPVMEDFINEADQYSAWQRAIARYDRRKEAFEERQAAETQRVAAEAKQAEVASQQAFDKKLQGHNARVAAFTQSTPDFASATQELVTRTLPPLVLAAIVESDNGPQVMLDLARHPDFLDEVSLLAYGVPVDEFSVATLQRRLHQHAQAASTGSAAVSRNNPAPRPPNPVRTGPIHTGDELPGDDSSLAAHEKAFGPKSR